MQIEFLSAGNTFFASLDDKIFLFDADGEEGNMCFYLRDYKDILPECISLGVVDFPPSSLKRDITYYSGITVDEYNTERFKLKDCCANELLISMIIEKAIRDETLVVPTK